MKSKFKVNSELVLSISRSWRYFRRVTHEFGILNLSHLTIHRLLCSLSPQAAVERFYIVAQPVVEPMEIRRGKSIEVRRILQGDLSLLTFQRIPEEIDERFKQGALCLGAFDGSNLVGWIWLAFEQFREFNQPLHFILPRSGRASWDLDIFIRPDYRLRPVFGRLWQAANNELLQRHFKWTISSISAYNSASLSAHRRLGARVLGSIGVLRMGQLRIVLAGRLGPCFRWSTKTDFRTMIRLPELGDDDIQ